MSVQIDDYPIDIVLAWVDGSDPEWLSEKSRYSPGEISDARVSRYRSWDTLQYIFRGIETFAPWVNSVFFITCGHLPKWLNTDHPNLRIINHKDYIPAEYLPTFNANTIELNFHRISELSENFIYFNDDMFLLNNTRAEDFFVEGKPCDCAVLTAHSHKEDSFFCFYNYRATGMINKYFDSKEVIKSYRKGWLSPKYGKMLFRSWVLSGFPRFTGIWQHHLPSSLLKSIMEELWEKEGDKLHQTCLNRFRSMLDFNQWLFKEWQLAQNNFFPRSVKFGKNFVLDNNEIFLAANDYVRKQKGKAVCINDPNDYVMTDEQFDAAKMTVIDSFELILPDKSGYEA